MSQAIIKKINISVLYGLLFKGSQQVVALGLGVVLARILSPAEFGVIAIANMIVFYANNFTNFGLNNALVQKTDINNSHINTVFTIDLALSVALAAFTCFSAGSIAKYFNAPDVALVLKWMSTYYVITTFYYMPVVLLRRNIDFKFLSIVEFLQGLLISVLSIVLALNDYSYWSIVISSLSIPFLATLLFIFKTGWVPKIEIHRDMADIYSFGLWVFVRNQMELLVSKVDYFVIGKFLNISSLGLYEKSFELTDRAMSGMTKPLNSVFFSAFCRLNNDLLQVKNVFLEGTALLGLICYPALFGLIGVAPHFVHSCLGDQWGNMVLPVQILSAACIFRVLFGMVASANVAIGMHKAHTLMTSLSAGIFIILCLVCVKYGIVGVSIAFLIYCIISFLSSFWLIYKNINITCFELLISLWCPLVGSIVMLFVVLLGRTYLLTDFSSISQFLCLVAVGGGAYLSWCYFFYKKGIIHLTIKGMA